MFAPASVLVTQLSSSTPVVPSSLRRAPAAGCAEACAKGTVSATIPPRAAVCAETIATDTAPATPTIAALPASTTALDHVLVTIKLSAPHVHIMATINETVTKVPAIRPASNFRKRFIHVIRTLVAKLIATGKVEAMHAAVNVWVSVGEPLVSKEEAHIT